jgi:hypothetical protein
MTLSPMSTKPSSLPSGLDARLLFFKAGHPLAIGPRGAVAFGS